MTLFNIALFSLVFYPLVRPFLSWPSITSATMERDECHPSGQGPGAEVGQGNSDQIDNKTSNRNADSPGSKDPDHEIRMIIRNQPQELLEML